MKKNFSLLLIPLLFLLCGCVKESPEPLYTPPQIAPEDRAPVRSTEINGIHYTLYNDLTCEITDADAELYDTSSLVLPEAVNECTVIAIADNVFQGGSFTHISLPKTLRRIGARAFSHTQLVSVDLPDSLETLGEEAFATCMRLEEITLPGSLETVPVGAFYGCRGLKSITLEEGIVTVGEEAFGDIPDLEKLSLPKSLRHIEAYAFWRCGTQELQFAIPEGVETVGVSAFEETAWLDSCPEEWVLVGKGVLLRYNGTDTAPVLPEEVRYLSNAFDNTSAETLTLPETLEGAAADALAESGIKEVHYEGSIPSLIALKK